LAARCAHEIADPFPGAAHIVRVRGVCAHARNAQELVQLLEPGLVRGLGGRRGVASLLGPPRATTRFRAYRGKPRAWLAECRERAAGRDGLGGDVAELLRLSQGLQLLQALVLDLAHTLAGDVESPPDLVERPGMLAVEAVAKLEHAPLARRQGAEDSLERLLAQRRLRRLVRSRCRLVGEEVAELRLLLVAHRLLEGDGGLRAPANLLDLLAVDVQLARDLVCRRVVP